VNDSLRALIGQTSSESFDSLALSVWNERAAGAAPAVAAPRVSRWQDVPFTTTPSTAANPSLLPAVLAAEWSGLSSGGRAPGCLVLIAPPDGEAATLEQRIGEQALLSLGGEGSVRACGPRGIEAAAVRSWCGAQQRSGRPVVVVATADTLRQWQTSLSRMDLRFRMAADSLVIVLVGPGIGASQSGDDESWMEERLAIRATQVVRAYGAPGMVSRCLARGSGPYECPAWVRARILDPESGADLEPGRVGRLALFDLAGEGTHLHFRTDDVAVAEGAGFRLHKPATPPV
jgi:hypothetical protein